MEPSQALPFGGCLAEDTEAPSRMLTLVGLPDDSQSSWRRGSAEAPRRVREAYDGNCYSATTESGVDLRGQVADLGDLASAADWNQTAKRYQEFAESLLRQGKVPFFIGGDHAVTIPIVAALAALGEPIHVVQLDAHPDLYPEYQGSRSSHACTAARCLEMDHVAGIIQLGVRSMNEIQGETARAYSTRMASLSAAAWREAGQAIELIPKKAVVYLTLDLDVFDPAFAPGVAHGLPGGITPRLALNFLQQLPNRIVGVDAVEVNPGLDHNDRTSVLAARLLQEAMGSVLRQGRG